MRTTIAMTLLLVSFAAGAATPPAEPAAPDPNATELEPMVINPPPNPYDALANIRRSLPCLDACDGEAIKARKSALERAKDFILLRAEPPKELSDAQKQQAAQFCQNPGPGMDYYCLR